MNRQVSNDEAGSRTLVGTLSETPTDQGFKTKALNLVAAKKDASAAKVNKRTKSQKQFGLVKVDQDHHDRSDLGLAMDLHAIEQQQFHQDHHPAVDLLGVQQDLSLEHQQQPDHHLRQHQQQQVDHTPVIRSKLEQLAYQLQNLNTSDHIQGRFHFSSAWRLNEKTQVRILTFF